MSLESVSFSTQLLEKSNSAMLVDVGSSFRKCSCSYACFVMRGIRSGDCLFCVYLSPARACEMSVLSEVHTWLEMLMLSMARIRVL